MPSESPPHKMFNEEELFFNCPYCAQSISFLCEQLYGNQSYIEDCEVCCQPIQITIFTTEEGVIQSFDIKRAD